MRAQLLLLGAAASPGRTIALLGDNRASMMLRAPDEG